MDPLILKNESLLKGSEGSKSIKYLISHISCIQGGKDSINTKSVTDTWTEQTALLQDP
jgi:hypothetical protein